MTAEVFVDTSALFATLDRDDANGTAAVAGMQRLLDPDDPSAGHPVTHGSVVAETAALVQRRLGMEAVRVVLQGIVPLMEVVWVDEQLHARTTEAFLAANRRSVSLVDWTSFLVMRDRAIDVAFAFDDDFVAQGFELYTA